MLISSKFQYWLNKTILQVLSLLVYLEHISDFLVINLPKFSQLAAGKYEREVSAGLVGLPFF